MKKNVSKPVKHFCYSVFRGPPCGATRTMVLGKTETTFSKSVSCKTCKLTMKVMADVIEDCLGDLLRLPPTTRLIELRDAYSDKLKRLGRS